MQLNVVLSVLKDTEPSVMLSAGKAQALTVSITLPA